MIIYNGKNLEDFGVEAIGRGRYGSPARDIEQVHVPGLNGDLLFDSGGFLNATVEYPDCCIDHDFPTNFAALRTFLLADPGYHRLEDSYASDEFRMAEFRGPLTPDVHTGRGNRSGTFTLQFNCTPQRYLKEGGEEREIHDQEIIENKWMPANPIFRIIPGANKTVNIAVLSPGWESYRYGRISVTDSTGSDTMIYEIDMIRGTAIRYEEATSYTKYNAASSVTGNILTIPSGKYKWSIAGTGQVFVKPMFWRI